MQNKADYFLQCVCWDEKRCGRIREPGTQHPMAIVPVMMA